MYLHDMRGISYQKGFCNWYTRPDSRRLRETCFLIWWRDNDVHYQQRFRTWYRYTHSIDLVKLFSTAQGEVIFLSYEITYLVCVFSRLHTKIFWYGEGWNSLSKEILVLVNIQQILAFLLREVDWISYDNRFRTWHGGSEISYDKKSWLIIYAFKKLCKCTNGFLMIRDLYLNEWISYDKRFVFDIRIQ